jgi:4-hydroxybenzoate polyprenyltransferase
MTIDDILDYDIDGLVDRTKGRPIPRGSITLSRAWLFFVIQVVVGVWAALSFLRPGS